LKRSGESVVEILPFFLSEGRVHRLHPTDSGSWQVGLDPSIHPGDVARDTCARFKDPPITLHSTSWRFEGERLVLTYAAVMREPKGRPRGFRAVLVKQSELARSTAVKAPEAIQVEEVVEHALRHLAWLVRHDPTIRDALGTGWQVPLAAYRPEPFSAFDLSGALSEQDDRFLYTPHAHSLSQFLREPAARSVINVPPPPTDFIGRGEELSELKNLLADAKCRLLTLVGPGGTGKTRLAVEAARETAPDFVDGVYFVALQPVTSAEFVVPAIADAVMLSLRGQEEPRVQLFNHLSEKHLLLVLDNFEHLVAAAGLLSEMLSAAPELKLMVTTREALKLSEEWVFPVPGMRFPEGTDVAGPENYDAVRLFSERAQRVKRGYSPEADWAAIARLCHLVQGMPLAVELAASWVNVLSCDEIVAEIERNLDFLASSLRNVPERHRSVRAVFEESWSLLGNEERDAFGRLSVFRGTFGREAAEKVAGASLPLLSTLVDKSLLKPLPQSRYLVHELLSQYAMEKLAESPADVDSAHDSHCAYYSDFLRQRTPDLLGGRQLEAGSEIEAELDNIRAAWQWAADHVESERLRGSIPPLAQCWEYKSRYAEAATALEGAAASLREQGAGDEIDLALAAVLVQLAWFYIRLGRLEEAEAAVTDGQSIYDRLAAPPDPAFATDPRLALGVIATIKGEYGEAARLGEEARTTSEENEYEGNREVAYYVLARAAFLQGEYEEAREYAQRASEIATEIGDRWFLAYPLIELGNVACALGDLAAASDYYQKSYNLRKEFDDPEGMAIALTYLGEVALQQQSYAEAQELYQQAIFLYQDIHDKGGLAASLAGMAKAAAAQEDYDAAREHFGRALQLAADIQHIPQILSLITGTGEMLLRTGETEGGLALLALALHHPASDHETKSWAQRVVAGCDAEVSPDVAVQRGGLRELEKAMSVLQGSLSMTSDLGIRALLERAAEAAQPTRAPSYPDELTEREVEVLRLMAKGRSNRQIAEELFITQNTVANHVKNILSKTQSANRTEAAAYATEKKLV
jgi:predicted ATPase/DNA-binding CsgD family transcriptional regulator